VVDDYEDVRELMVMILQEEGYEVASAADGGSAVARAREGKVDLVLMDVNLAGESGIEVARQIAAFRPAVSFLYVTGSVPMSAAGDPPAGDVIVKPFLAPELLARVDEVLRRA
jgi:two-component system, OmpR family, response regulator